MSFKSFMGSISPLYGAVSGEGMMGKMLNPDEAAKIAAKERARQIAAEEQAETERQNQIAAQAKSEGMKKGGKVKSASARGDGIAQRGKTRGKMY
jgi:hypothetical protein